jgi:hypothetical protein
MTDKAREIIDEYKKNPKKCIEQIEFCNYENEVGILRLNVAWIALKEILQEVEK